MTNGHANGCAWVRAKAALAIGCQTDRPYKILSPNATISSKKLLCSPSF